MSRLKPRPTTILVALSRRTVLSHCLFALWRRRSQKTDYYGNVGQQVRLLVVFPPEDRADDGAEPGGAKYEGTRDGNHKPGEDG